MQSGIRCKVQYCSCWTLAVDHIHYGWGSRYICHISHGGCWCITAICLGQHSTMRLHILLYSVQTSPVIGVSRSRYCNEHANSCCMIIRLWRCSASALHYVMSCTILENSLRLASKCIRQVFWTECTNFHLRHRHFRLPFAFNKIIYQAPSEVHSRPALQLLGPYALQIDAAFETHWQQC
jgi:hypothetical protein